MRGKGRKCPLTGVTESKLPEAYVTPEGKFDPSLYPDSNCFDVRTMAAEAGFKSWRYFRDEVLTDQSSPFHAHQVKDGARTIAWVTNTTSARAGGVDFRKLSRQRSTGYDPDEQK